MHDLEMFVPLVKADAAQRLVYGYIDETPDTAGEIMDYATAKPAFQSWSDAVFAKSGGRSRGNIRAQHDMKKAAGALRELVFDDENKRVGFVAHIVDDGEWAKVEAGVYTGFSPGGKYAKRWVSGPHHRYTPTVQELSIVDVPCIPTGAFTLVKADGAEVQVDFIIADAEPAADAAPTVDASDALDAAFSKADEAVANATAVTGARVLDIYAAAGDGTLRKAAVVTDLVVPTPEAIALIGADLAKSRDALALISAASSVVLEKTIYSVRPLSDVLGTFSYLVQDIIDEEQREGDTASKLPQMAITILAGLKNLLIAMVQEEVCELLTRCDMGSPAIPLDLTAGDPDPETLELATKIVDLAKADTVLLAKAATRNGKDDTTHLQRLHDAAMGAGAVCDADKHAQLTAQNARMNKAVSSALPRIETLTKTVGTLTTERDDLAGQLAKALDDLELLKGKPAPTKRDLAFTKTKGEDGISPVDGGGDDLAKVDPIAAANDLEPAARQRELERLAMAAKFRTR
jgi:hypothetical protein